MKLQLTWWRLYILLDPLSKCAMWIQVLLGAALHAAPRTHNIKKQHAPAHRAPRVPGFRASTSTTSTSCRRHTRTAIGRGLGGRKTHPKHRAGLQRNNSLEPCARLHDRCITPSLRILMLGYGGGTASGGTCCVCIQAVCLWPAPLSSSLHCLRSLQRKVVGVSHQTLEPPRHKRWSQHLTTDAPLPPVPFL